MALTNKSFVKWMVPGGWSFAKVLEINGDKAKLEFPNESVGEKAIAELHEIDETQYQVALKSLVDSLKKKITVANEGESDMADKNQNENKDTKVVAELEKQLEDAKAANVKLTEQVKTLTDNAAAVKTAADASQRELETVKAQLSEIEKARKGEARFAEIKELDGIAAIAENDKDAKTALAGMEDTVYAATLKMAKSFKKLTQITVTNKAKLTEQTVTNKTKLTEASDKSEEVEAVEETAVEGGEDTTVATAAVAGKTAPSAFSAAVNKFIVKKVKSEKDKE